MTMASAAASQPLRLVLLDQSRLEQAEAQWRHSVRFSELVAQMSPQQRLMKALLRSEFKKHREEWTAALWAARQDADWAELADVRSSWWQRVPSDVPEAWKSEVALLTPELTRPWVYFFNNVQADLMRWLAAFLARPHLDLLTRDASAVQLEATHRPVRDALPLELRPVFDEVAACAPEMTVQLAGLATSLDIPALQVAVALVMAQRLRDQPLATVMAAHRMEMRSAVIQKLLDIGRDRPWWHHFRGAEPPVA